MTDSPPSARSILAALGSEEDDNVFYLCAAAINLQSEALRKMRGRMLWKDEDVRNLFSILEILLQSEEPEQSYAPKPGRTPTLDEEERDGLMAAVTARVERRA